MATEFLMPKLGLTMEEGTITEWFADDGASITAGAPLLRIETDKTETDVEAAATGRLHRVGQVGETFACGERIGWFLDEGEDAPASAAPAAAAPAAAVAAAPPPGAAPTTAAATVAHTGRVVASPLTKRLALERNIDLRTVRGTGPGGRIVAADLDNLPAAGAPSLPAPPVTAQPVRPAATVTGTSMPATAAARSLADLLGVDLAQVPVDPIEQRITKDSVALHVRGLIAGGAAPSPAPAPTLLPALQEPTRTVRLSGIRGTIAKRMHESLRQMAQLTLFMDADLDAVVEDRERRKESGSAPSYTDYVIAAAARALGQHPLVNSQITDDGVALLPTAHVGMAVALDEGLIVPVIRDTASLDLTSLSVESSRLAAAARSGSLELPDLEGGTFSVSTLGMYGVDGFTPVINPPNTAILGVGRLRDELALSKKGKVRVHKRLTLSLTWDHRAFDGAPAAAFCRTIADLLGDPDALDAT
ncbi:MAG TPA: dihydrolipoamide acetyltransferase family protein [Ilumatobacteraceae bacterium]|nr:dihydrolipoamide acetyltransferase family protein [Ilumatobacteraceae bacterium]